MIAEQAKSHHSILAHVETGCVGDLVLISPLFQVLEEATGEFDPIGTLIVLILLATFAYGAYWTWNRAGTTESRYVWGWRIAAILLWGLAVLIVVSLVLNLLAALGAF